MSNSPLFQIPPGMLALAGQAPGEAPQPKETSPRSRSVKRVSTRANFANDPINRDNLPAGMAALPAAQAKLPAPAIDAPEQAAAGTTGPSPGMIVLQELRRRHGKPSGPLELAGTEEVQQRPWQADLSDEEPPKSAEDAYGPSYYKMVRLGENPDDWLHFHVTPTDNASELNETYGPEINAVRREHELGLPHEFLFTRRYVHPPTGQWRVSSSVTKMGKAGEIMSHAVHALREFVREHRPAMVTFTAAEPSRVKLYEHLARRAAADPSNSEYRAYYDHPGSFHLIHHVFTDLPAVQRRLRDMEPILPRARPTPEQVRPPAQEPATADMPPGMTAV